MSRQGGEAYPELMVVDDNELLLTAMKRWLQREIGWESYCFSDPYEALEFGSGRSIDIVIADLYMPVMNGIDFLERFQETHEDTVQILMTGFDYHDTVIEAINRLRLYFFLEKPWDSQKLELILYNAWEKRRLTRAFDQQLDQVQETIGKLRATQDDLMRHKNQATIGRLIQGVCHNLNSPLGVIVGQCQLLSMRLEGAKHVPASMVRSSLDDITEATERMRHIISNLMVKSRMEQMPHRQKISIDDLIRQELAFLQADPFLKEEVECRLSLQADALDLYLNYADFSQIFTNLVRNALDATSGVDGPCLEIKTEIDEGSFVMEIHDNGPGVPDELREQIFEPFFTTKAPVEDSASSKALADSPGPQGTGLGLHSVVELLAPYKGHVEVRESPLGGACFRVALPIDKVQAAPAKVS